MRTWRGKPPSDESNSAVDMQAKRGAVMVPAKGQIRCQLRRV